MVSKRKRFKSEYGDEGHDDDKKGLKPGMWLYIQSFQSFFFFCDLMFCWCSNYGMLQGSISVIRLFRIQFQYAVMHSALYQ